MAPGNLTHLECQVNGEGTRQALDEEESELLIVLQYLDGNISGETFVDEMNYFVRIGERTGKIKGPAPPFTHDTGKELAYRFNGRKWKSSASEEDKN